MTHQIVCEVQDGDDAWVKAFLEDVRGLAESVDEIMGSESRLLLSPVFRNLVRDKAQKVRAGLTTLGLRHVVVDNLGKPLDGRPVCGGGGNEQEGTGHVAAEGR